MHKILFFGTTSSVLGALIMAQSERYGPLLRQPLFQLGGAVVVAVLLTTVVLMERQRAEARKAVQRKVETLVIRNLTEGISTTIDTLLAILRSRYRECGVRADVEKDLLLILGRAFETASQITADVKTIQAIEALLVEAQKLSGQVYRPS